MKNNSWVYFLVTLFTLTSGAKVWVGTLSHAVAFIIFLFFSICFFYKIHKCIFVYNKSFGFIIFITTWSIISFIANGQNRDNSLFGYIFCTIATYYCLYSIPFYVFRKALTDIVFLFTLVGIPVYLLYGAGLLPTQIIEFSDSTYKVFGLYTLGHPNDFGRYTGIWHEAGACQIILNSVLWIHFDNFVHWKWNKGELLKIIVVFIGSLMTLSTGSYMCLMLLTVGVVLNLKIKTKHSFLLYTSLFIISASAVFVLYQSDVVQEKLFADGADEHISKIQRTADILAFWQMAQEKPLLGYGLGTEIFWKVSTRLGNTANSSGVMTYLASLGFPWLFFFLYYLWGGIGRIVKGKARFFLLAAIILMQFNEKFIEYPITNMFIFYYLNCKVRKLKTVSLKSKKNKVDYKEHENKYNHSNI